MADEKEPVKVCVRVHGGLVTDVFSNNPDVVVEVVDVDCMEVEKGEEEVEEVESRVAEEYPYEVY